MLAAAARAAGLTDLRAVAQLGGSNRTEVWRVATAGSASEPATSYVVKIYRDRDGDTFAREPAALGALAGSGVAPTLVGAGTDPDLVVMTDAGAHPNVADRLLGRDPAAAEVAVEHWVDTLATLHLAATDAVLDDYARRLASRSRDTATHRVPEALAYAADRLVSLGEAVDLPPSPELLEILTDLPSRLTPTAPVLTPGDACPDNNLLTADGALLIDFEFAEVRHPAWDVAYLRVPWPTCWCSWRLPTAVADRAVARYVERVAPSVPYVGSDAFRADLDLATLGWCLMTASWSVRSVLEEDTVPRLEGPSTWPRMLHRLWLAGQQPGPPPLTSYARDLYRVLVRRWGEPTLVLAPAFRDEDIAIP